MRDDRIERLIQALLTSEAEGTVHDLAGHVGDQVHEVLKRNGMLMKSTAGAIGMGVLAAVQLLSDTLEFAWRSMETEEDQAAITAAIAELFVSEAPTDLRLACKGSV